MSQDYKGYTIPSYTDAGDAPRAFMDLVDDIDAKAAGAAADLSGKVDRAGGTMTVQPQAAPSVRNIHLSTAAPLDTQGIDGDLWVRYV